MASVFCCSSIVPYRPRILDHESKFESFLDWARSFKPETSICSTTNDLADLRIEHTTYAIQIVQQVNFGNLESKRYFIVTNSTSKEDRFREVKEDFLIDANFEKLNSYKNFKCSRHNKFFELNIYQKNPINSHHWRSNIARPSTNIDLPTPTKTKMVINTEGLSGKTTKDRKTPTVATKSLLDPDDSEGDYDDRRDCYSHDDSGRSSPQDFTACSLEDCGYCGHCDY